MTRCGAMSLETFQKDPIIPTIFGLGQILSKDSWMSGCVLSMFSELKFKNSESMPYVAYYHVGMSCLETQEFLSGDSHFFLKRSINFSQAKKKTGGLRCFFCVFGVVCLFLWLIILHALEEFKKNYTN